MASFGMTIDLDYEFEDDVWTKWSHFCGGAIVGDNAIITAAHCFKTGHNSSTQIRVGDEYLNRLADDDLSQTYDITTLVKHPDYDGFESDVAVVFTSKKIDTNKNVKPLCLPTEPEMDEDIWSSNTVYLTGWGLIDEWETRENDSLNEASLTVYPKSGCSNFYEDLTANILCAGHEVCIS